ncbi:hypothetical protein [Roseomonas sp. AR75]|uniref:hypothetical protein n=1 Tax=Roseomonas sp. AR75 TaxID=2562311 RepID=UPI0010C0CD24|nr:hypothetical protein [Roseomonas sp. AR75]
MAKRNELPRHDDPTEIDPRPQPASRRGPGAAGAQRKQDIDAGVAGDKVGMFDPGMADGDTGAEAAGTPTPPEMIRRDREMQRMPDAPHGDPGREMALGKGGMIAAVFGALVALGLMATLFG